MKFIDFFAGIGGFRRGMELAGHECVGFCEFDKFAVASYTSMHLITDEQREALAEIPIKQRQKEILKDEYRNGEWYANDIRSIRADEIPRADCWCFGFPCQDISIAGKQEGFNGHRSSLFFAVTRLIRDLEEKDRPEYLFIENVKNLLSINRGGDFLKLLIELDEIGYDAEWQLLNSKDFGVPQNRERVFIIGHSRRFSSRKVFPIQGTSREDGVYQLGQLYGTDKEPNPSGGRVYDINGMCPTVGAGHGMSQPQIGLPCFIDMNYGAGVKETENARTLQARYNKGIGNRSGETSGVAIPVEINCININDGKGKERPQQERIYDTNGVMTALNSQLGGRHNVAIPVLTPDRAEKRQNGRRFKDSGVYTNHSPDYNRGILDGASRTLKADSHPAGVALGFIDSQGRNNKEVSLKDVCSTLRSESHGNVPNVCINVNEAPNCGDGIFVEMPEGFIVYAIWYEKYQCYIAIRKLTPKECFRLQGWTDDYFERAAFVNSDSQLYKQAGNGVTVIVIQAMAEKM